MALTFGLMGGLGLAHSALALGLPQYSAHVYKGPPGSHSTFLAISADGTAVGQRVLADGTSHAVRLSRGKRKSGGSPFAGNQSSLSAIDVNDEAVGTVFGTGFAHPVFLSGSKATTLPVTGNAVGVALGPQVAVRATVSGDPVTHVLVWNPATGSVRDLGQGFASAINANGIVVGQTLGGQAAYWSADGVLHNLGFAGTLNRINLFGQAVGFALRSGPGGGATPIMLDLRRPAVITTLKLPPGWPFGIPKDISDSGLIVGDAFTDRLALTSEGVLWASPTKPTALQKLVRGRGLKGFALTDAEGVDINGLIVGSVTPSTTHKASASQNPRPDEEDVALDYPERVPSLGEKAAHLSFLARQFATRLLPRSKGAEAADHLVTMIRELETRIRQDRLRDACASVKQVRGLIEQFTQAPSDWGSQGLPAFKKGSIDSLSELKRELKRLGTRC